MSAVGGLIAMIPAKTMVAGIKTINPGETAVALAVTQSCKFVWIGAPHADGTGGVNLKIVLIGDADTQEMVLAIDDYKGFILSVQDPSMIYIKSLVDNDGDQVNFIIFN